MATPKFAWGIDIGNRALKAIKLVREGDAIRVDDFDVIEHETVLSNSGDNRETFIVNALRNFAERHPMKGGAVSVGVSGQSSFARFIKLPPVEEKKIPEIVRFEAIQQIPFPLDDVEWSYQLFRGEDSPDVEVGIFAMRKELINQHIKNFTDQDLNVQVVQMNPLACYNAMYYDQRIDGTTMIIDLGAENTDLIIADADTIWLRSIPIGGNNFTETLVKSFKLNFAKAEDLKRNAATSKYARQIFQAMRPVFADLVAEVQRSIGFYASVHRDSRIKKIVAVGGTFKLPGLQKYLQQNLQLDVERLDTLGAGAPPDPKQAATFQDNILSLVSAYGLGLQAMGEGKITSSLLPARIRRERLWQDKTKYFAAAAALFILGTGIGFTSIFFNDMRYEAAGSHRTTIQGVQGQATELSGKWDEITGRGGADKQRILNIRSMLQYRGMYDQILKDIEQSVPKLALPPDQIKKTPRSERREIKIDAINNIYYPDLSPIGDLKVFSGEQNAQMPPLPPVVAGIGPQMTSSAMMQQPGAEPGGFSGMPAPGEGATPAPVATPAGPTGHGYIIRITGTTPVTTAVGLINETIVKGLLDTAKDKAHARPYRFEKVDIVSLRQLRNDQQRLTAIKSAYDSALAAKQSGTFTPSPSPGGGGYGIGGGFNPEEDRGTFNPGFNPAAGAQPAGPTGEEAYKDRLFPDEDIRDDQVFVIAAMVLVDPPPATEAPAAANGEAPASAPATEGAAPAAPATPAAPAATPPAAP